MQGFLGIQRTRLLGLGGPLYIGNGYWFCGGYSKLLSSQNWRLFFGKEGKGTKLIKGLRDHWRKVGFP